MSLPNPPQNELVPDEKVQRYRRTIHNVALGALIACPVLAILPPRKLDIYTIGLICTTGYSANYLIHESSGRSIWQHVGRQPGTPITKRLGEDGVSAVGEIQRDGRGYQQGWKAQRHKEIKEDVEEGKSFGDMIVDQIWEVWNQGNVPAEEDDQD